MPFSKNPCGRWLGLVLILLSSAAAAQPLRLADDVVPTFEAIELRLDPREARYRGSVRIELAVRAATDRFHFHARGQTLLAVALQAADGTPVAVEHQALSDEVVEVVSAAALEAGAYTLEIDYEKPFNTRGTSIYRMDKDGDSYVYSDFEPDDAREAFPCWDEPHFKIPFQMTLVVPAAHLALSNTPILEETVDGGWRTVVFKKSPPLPTYLLALAVGPFETVPVPGMSAPGRVVTVRGQSHLAQLAVEVTPPILRAMEKYFGSPYPFAKLDLIAVPEYWSGGMENAGAITFADNILLVDRATASVRQRRRLIAVMAHELAHMWFGDLVTMRWWDDLWLNESFADWTEAKIVGALFPELGTALTEVSDTDRILILDARATTRSIRQPIASPKDMMSDIGLAYTKGRAVLDMFERWVGPEVFREGVFDFLTAHAWGNATAADFGQALDKASAEKISEAMAGFLEQPGFPLIEVEVLADGGVELRQERFRNHGVSSPDLSWRLPVALRYPTAGGPVTETFLLDAPRRTVRLAHAPAPPAWIFPKAGAVGYYRWTVSAENLRTLVEQAGTALTPRERIELAGNASALLAAGRLRGAELLDLLARLGDDPEPLVITALIRALDGVELALVPPELEEAFAGYVRRSLKPAWERFGPQSVNGEDEAISLLRPELYRWLGKRGRDPRILRRAEAMARSYMADPASVDPALVDPALCLSAGNGDRALFEEYRKRLEASAKPAERIRYLSALGAFDHPELREELLRYVLEGPLRPDETFAIYNELLDDEPGRNRGFRWFRENYERITSRMPPHYAAYMPIFADGCSSERLKKAEIFFGRPEHRVRGTEQQMEKLAERVNDCVNLRLREGAAVARYLKEN